MVFDAAGVEVQVRPDGVVVYTYTMDMVDEAQAYATLENTEEQLRALDVKVPAPSLVRMGPVSKVTREARQVFSESEVNARLASRVALIATNSISRIIGNFFLGFNRSHRPTRLFADEASAIDWLLSEED